MGIVIVAMVLSFTLIVVKLGLDYSKSKLLESGGQPADSTLLMSELQEMIASAVSDATEPLRERIDQLEQKQLSSGPSAEAPILSSGDTADSGVHPPEAI